MTDPHVQLVIALLRLSSTRTARTTVRVCRSTKRE
jgi:hypothetical protein